jgi:hypothetical protein
MCVLNGYKPMREKVLDERFPRKERLVKDDEL